MIRNFDKQTHELTDDELNRVLPLVIRGLQSHIGKNNAISSRTIQKALKDKFDIKLIPTRLRKIINHLRINDRLPFLCSCGHGYYIGTPKDLKDTIHSMQERISSMQNVVNSLNRQLTQHYDI